LKSTDLENIEQQTIHPPLKPEVADGSIGRVFQMGLSDYFVLLPVKGS
tara:strand:+ start:1373 stop:1516 length:144 start_codon:yes stop_codon:yes gene_type:complete